MKYLQTINLSSGATTTVVTTVNTEPYNVFLLDSSEHSLHLTRDLSSPLSVFGMIAFGAYQTDTKWKTITIEGEIDLPE